MTNLVPPVILAQLWHNRAERCASLTSGWGIKTPGNANARSRQRKRWLDNPSILKINAVGTRRPRLTILTEPRG